MGLGKENRNERRQKTGKCEMMGSLPGAGIVPTKALGLEDSIGQGSGVAAMNTKFWQQPCQLVSTELPTRSGLAGLGRCGNRVAFQCLLVDSDWLPVRSATVA